MYKIVCFLLVILLMVSCKNDIGRDLSRSESTDSISMKTKQNSILVNLFFSSEKDDENYADHIKIRIASEGDSLGGYIIGGMYEGGHGVYYFATVLEDILPVHDGYTFKIIPGHLFPKPITLQQYLKRQKLPKSVGIDHQRYQLRLSIDERKAQLSCAADDPSQCSLDTIALISSAPDFME